MSRELEWEKEFSDLYYEFTKTLPLIRKGRIPLQDIQASKLADVGRAIWFYYPITRMHATDWYDLLAMMEFHPNVQIDISTALDLSETIGMSEGIDIPDLWVMCVEIFPSK